MRQIVLFFFLCLMVINCEPKLKPAKPENLIPQDKMTEILYDLFVLNSAKGINRRKLEASGIDPERYVLEKYNIDSLQFVLSNDYYAYDIETYNAIIETVKKRLTKEKTQYEAINKKEKELKKLKKDSIKRLKLKKN